jgi:hypothetical protein
MQKIRIFLNKDRAYIKFNYNEEIIQVMHEFNARWSKFDKMWTLPESNIIPLYDYFKKEGFDVTMRRLDGEGRCKNQLGENQLFGMK